MELFRGRYILRGVNEPADKIRHLERMLSHGGGSAAGYYELGGLKLSRGDPGGAVAAYGRALELEPGSAEIANNLGAALLRTGRLEAAVGSFERALAVRPKYLRALVNLGKALCELGRGDEALVRLREALLIDPDYVPALVNFGDALVATGDLPAAETILERAVRLAPTLIEARLSLGMARLHSRRIDSALEALQTAVALSPAHPDANSNLAHARFVSGAWDAAWPHFEHRFRRRARPVLMNPPAGMVRWDGRLAPVQKLWVLGEQGLGDQLQFARYVRVLTETGAHCVLACDRRLVPILNEARLGARVVALDAIPEEPDFRWFPLLSLPAWHATTPQTVPFPGGYLQADPVRVDRWRNRLPPRKGIRVALAWAGNPKMETGAYRGRSPPLSALAPLMAVPEVSFVSVQHSDEQLDSAPFAGAVHRVADLDPGTDAFLDTAAILKCVDLLITSDTAVAHLAGGLGVPTWLCLMRDPDWRWGLSGKQTPWYTSMRLFRQSEPADWAGVYARIAAELAHRVRPET